MAHENKKRRVETAVETVVGPPSKRNKCKVEPEKSDKNSRWIWFANQAKPIRVSNDQTFKDVLPKQEVQLINNGPIVPRTATFGQYFDTSLFVDRIGDTVLFVKTLTGATITLHVNQNDTIGVIKQMVQDLEGIPPDQQRYVFGGKPLEDEKTVKDSRLSNHCTIHLVMRLRGGGCSFNFVDIHENPLQQGNFSQEAPSWRMLNDGLALAGMCTTKTCKAFEQEVLCNVGYGSFNLAQVVASCPVCHQKIVATKPYFSSCWLRYVGQREDGVTRTSEWINCCGEGFKKCPDDATPMSWNHLKYDVQQEPPIIVTTKPEHVPVKCEICRLKLLPEDECYTIANCQHSFHHRCIDVWTSMCYASCPVCHVKVHLDPTTGRIESQKSKSKLVQTILTEVTKLNESLSITEIAKALQTQLESIVKAYPNVLSNGV